MLSHPTEREQPAFYIKLPADLLVSSSLTYRMKKCLPIIYSGVYSSDIEQPSCCFTLSLLGLLLSSPRMSVRKGKFPDFLMDAWEDYDHEQKSENDVPGQ